MFCPVWNILFWGFKTWMIQFCLYEKTYFTIEFLTQFCYWKMAHMLSSWWSFNHICHISNQPTTDYRQLWHMPHSSLVLKSSKNLSFIHTHLTFCLSGLWINCTVTRAVAWTGFFFLGGAGWTVSLFFVPKLDNVFFAHLIIHSMVALKAFLIIWIFSNFYYFALKGIFIKKSVLYFWSFRGSVTQIKRCILEHFNSQTSALLDSRISIDFDFHWFL